MSFKSTGTKTRPDRVKPPSSAPLNKDTTTNSRRSSNASSVASFHSARFDPEEEARLLASSNELKSAANAQFAKQDYSSALSTYDKAVAELPTYLDYELAVLSSNISACYLRLEEWKEALEAAEKGMDKLEKIIPLPKPKSHKKNGEDKIPSQKNDTDLQEDEDSQIIELPEDNDDAANEEILKKLDISDQRRSDVLRIRTKLLLRRARARYVLGTVAPTKSNPSETKSNPPDAFTTSSSWSNLSSAQSDYTLLATPEYFSILPASDKKTVTNALRTLPPLIEQAKEKEMGEMMGKLKELGNGILKPFGLSTDMFRMEKDENTGGMSLKFDGGKK